MSAVHASTPDDEDVGRAAARTGLAWSRTVIALAAVIGILGARAFLLGEPPVAVVTPLALSATLLLVNGAVTRRAWRSAGASMAAGRRPLHPRLILALAGVTTLLGIVMLAIMFDSLSDA